MSGADLAMIAGGVSMVSVFAAMIAALRRGV